MKLFLPLLFCLAVLSAKEKSLKLSELPPAVQTTVTAETKGAEVKNIVREKEKRKIVFEVETMVQGKTRDFVVDSDGKLVTVEEQLALESAPAPVRAAVEKVMAGGKLAGMERVAMGRMVIYEAIIEKKGKKKEFLFNADGSPKAK